jgi:hypothetical protein
VLSGRQLRLLSRVSSGRQACSPNYASARLSPTRSGRGSLGSLLYRRALGEAVATALAVRDGAPSTGPAPTYAQVQALVDRPGVTCR